VLDPVEQACEQFSPLSAEAVEAIRSAKSDIDESVRQAAERALGQADPK
jgi:hypothetical protein